MYAGAGEAPAGLWGGGATGLGALAGDYERLRERLAQDADAARAYLRERWAEFLTLGPRIIDAQHEAALLAQRCREAGDSKCEAEAKDSIRSLGELNLAHGWAVHEYELERVGQWLGLGAIQFVPVAALTGLALVVLWAFRAYDAETEKLRLIEAGVLTPEQAAALDPGPAPGILFSGATDLGQLALAGAALWIVFQLVSAYAPKRPRRNPALEVHTNPPGVIGDEVYSVTYRHADDGREYVHDFAPGVELEALPDGSVLISQRDGLPLWDDFEA